MQRPRLDEDFKYTVDLTSTESLQKIANYILWYEVREQYVDLGDNHFDLPKDLTKYHLDTINGWQAHGCRRDLILTAICVLAANHKEIEFHKAKFIHENLRKMKPAIKAINRLMQPRIGKEMLSQDEQLMFAELLPSMLERFCEVAEDLIRQSKEVEDRTGKSNYLHKQAILLLGSHLKVKLGKIPWTKIALLIQLLGRGVSAENLKEQYKKMNRISRTPKGEKSA